MSSSITINILNPKAVKLLKDLADLKLISIKTEKENGFKDVLKKLRIDAKNTLTLEDITSEVEKVRAKRYAK